MKTTTVASPLLDDLFVDRQDLECVEEHISDSSQDKHNPFASATEQQLVAALLKYEHLVHAPDTAIDNFLEELYYLINTASVMLPRGLGC